VWLASSASTDGCCERVVVSRTRSWPSVLTRDDTTLRKQTILVRVAQSVLSCGTSKIRSGEPEYNLVNSVLVVIQVWWVNGELGQCRVQQRTNGRPPEHDRVNLRSKEPTDLSLPNTRMASRLTALTGRCPDDSDRWAATHSVCQIPKQ
jgi:hypothetical protein